MSAMKDYQPLRLMAGDAEDLKIISAYLQDGVAKIGDMAYLPDQRRFALVVNRFVWECAPKSKAGPFARVRCGVHFDDVKSAQMHRLRLDAKDAVVELLSVRFEAGEDGAGHMLLDFAGGGGARLEVEAINAYLSDLSEPWRTRARPSHED